MDFSGAIHGIRTPELTGHLDLSGRVNITGGKAGLSDQAFPPGNDRPPLGPQGIAQDDGEDRADENTHKDYQGQRDTLKTRCPGGIEQDQRADDERRDAGHWSGRHAWAF